VQLVRHWAEREDVDPVVVFDGGEAGEEEREGVAVVWTGSETADDWIVREAARFAPYWLVTSDRELRKRAQDGERVIGGGSFARELRAR
jgi:YacP-like NYN domain-containing protein